MGLSADLISQFVKITKDTLPKHKSTTVYGTVVKEGTNVSVQIDGSEGRLTPIAPTTTDVENGDRVSVSITNHVAVITGNLTSPSARTDTVQEIDGHVQVIDGTVQDHDIQITTLEVVVADKVSTKVLEAEVARIGQLEAENAVITGKLTANEASIKDLEAENVTITGMLTANEASIKKLEADNVTINDTLTAANANITKLQTEKLSATEADLKYANIDFANIGEAAMKKIFADSGIIKDAVISGLNVTGELNGVTINGDLINANTLKANRLLVLGKDGLYYKLNVSANKVEGEQTDENSINGSVITAKTITANKITVDDLVAFGATIGGFHLTKSSIYSGVKESIDNTTRGIYLDNDGQVAFGDASNYLKFYKDSDGSYQLDISARSLTFAGSGTKVETAIVSSVDEFYVSTSPTSLTGGSWSTSQPAWSEGKYIWRRTLVTHANGTTEYSPSQNGMCVTGNTGATGQQGPQGEKGETGATGQQGPQGEKGETGDTGETGKGVTSVTGYYCLSSSATNYTGATWSTTVPEWVDGKYYWQQLRIVYTDGTVKWTNPTCITGGKGETGEKGDTGAKGETGATGNGVSEIVTQFYLSVSKTAQSGGLWSTTMPTWSNGKYLWTRSKITYTNGTVKYTTPQCDSSWEAANDAAKVATNYMKFEDGTGLIVGDMTAGTLGSNILIDADSMDIRLGDVVLASYEANTIYLGKNNTNAKIELCGGVGSITAEALDDSNDWWGLHIYSQNLINLSGAAVGMGGYTTFGSGHASTRFRLTCSDEWAGTTLDPRYHGALYINTEIGDYNAYGFNLQYIDINTVDGIILGQESTPLYADSQWAKIIIKASSARAEGLTPSITLEATDTKITGAMRFTANNSRIWGTETDGTEIEVFQAKNSSNNTVIGWGNYDTGSGNTNIYGNDVFIGSKESMNNGAYRPYYRGGDAFDIKISTSGFVTSSGNSVRFIVPLSKPIIGNPTVTASSVNGLMLRQNGKYTHGSSSSTYASVSSYTVDTTNKGNHVVIFANLSDTTNVTNNDAIGVHWSGRLTLSFG
jgi:hypothetical protein